MKVIFSTEDINSYGFWVKTKGIDLSRFKKNPVITFNHNTYAMSVGKVSNLKIENDQLVGDVEFDEEDTQGKELKRKYEKGFMNGFSIGIRSLKWSEDEADLKKGQTRQTVIKSELVEIAAATVPSNSNAVSLYDTEGNRIELSTKGANPLPSITTTNKMEKVIEELKLKADATELEVVNAIKNLQSAKAEAEKVAKSLTEASVEALIATGKEKGIINAETEKSYRKLAATDFELASKMINEVVKPAKASGTQKDISLAAELAKLSGKKGEASLKLLNEMSEDEVLELRKSDRAEYTKRYQLTYGIKPKIEE